MNVRKEVAQKRHINKWCKACEVEIRCHVNHTVTQTTVYSLLTALLKYNDEIQHQSVILSFILAHTNLTISQYDNTS